MKAHSGVPMSSENFDLFQIHIFGDQSRHPSLKGKSYFAVLLQNVGK